MSEQPEKIVVVGASGATGKSVVAEAVARGVQVVAIVRDASRFETPVGVKTVEASLSDVHVLAAALSGATALVSTLGVARRTPDEMPARHLPGIVQAMQEAGVDRYVGISGAGITLDGERKDLGGRIISWIVRKAAPVVIEDKELEYATLRRSDLAWTLVRAPRLVDGPSTGKLVLSLDKPASTKLTRGDMAVALLDQVNDKSHVGQAPYAGTKG